MKLEAITIEKPTDVNVILGQAHFIKTVEDLHEVLAGAVPGARFGIAFAEASGPCLIRHSGTDEELRKLAIRTVERIAAGHVFAVFLGNFFPINVLNAIKAVPEVCSIYCATANPLRVIIADLDDGRAVLGVCDGASPKGVEGETEISARKELLRRFGYKL